MTDKKPIYHVKVDFDKVGPMPPGKRTEYLQLVSKNLDQSFPDCRWIVTDECIDIQCRDREPEPDLALPLYPYQERMLNILKSPGFSLIFAPRQVGTTYALVEYIRQLLTKSENLCIQYYGYHMVNRDVFNQLLDLIPDLSIKNHGCLILRNKKNQIFFKTRMDENPELHGQWFSEIVNIFDNFQFDNHCEPEVYKLHCLQGTCVKRADRSKLVLVASGMASCDFVNALHTGQMGALYFPNRYTHEG